VRPAVALFASLALVAGTVDDGATTPAPAPAAKAAMPAATAAAPLGAAPRSKKDAYLDARRAAADAPPAAPPAAPPKLGAPPRPVVNLYNTWTHEWLTLDARKPEPTVEQVSRFLRCHFTNAQIVMEKRLLPTVVAAAVAFKVTRVDIVSGYRAPKYNLILRKKGRQVARDSQHTHGNAIDFRLPGVELAALHAWAVARKLGGVGRYVGSGFVHMDTDKIRYWDGE
jgi:uncharacterized protein YcbK (DUF882 family)